MQFKKFFFLKLQVASRKGTNKLPIHQTTYKYTTQLLNHKLLYDFRNKLFFNCTTPCSVIHAKLISNVKILNYLYKLQHQV